MKIEDIIRSLRNELRLSMNGVTAASMREKGVCYKMNFGVDLMRIREIAKGYEADKELAEELWNEDVRELKILASMLYPVGQYTHETSERWVVAITNQELREQLCRNIFQNLPFAGLLVNEWCRRSDEGVRTTGYWLFARLCITHASELDRVDKVRLMELAVGDLKGDSMLLRQAALNVLRFYGRMSEQNKEDVMQRVAHFDGSGDQYEQEVISQLCFEFNMRD